MAVMKWLPMCTRDLADNRVLRMSVKTPYALVSGSGPGIPVLAMAESRRTRPGCPTPDAGPVLWTDGKRAVGFVIVLLLPPRRGAQPCDPPCVSGRCGCDAMACGPDHSRHSTVPGPWRVLIRGHGEYRENPGPPENGLLAHSRCRDSGQCHGIVLSGPLPIHQRGSRN